MYAQAQRKLYSPVQLLSRVENGLKLQRDERLFDMGNPSTETIFFEACESGDMKLAKRLLGCRDFDPTQYDGIKKTAEGRTCLHLAVLAGDRVLLKTLVEKINQQKFTDEVDKRGDTALHLAVWKYRVDLVKVLLDDCKADLSLKNIKGETPLCVAVKLGLLDVVKELIDPDPKAATKRLLKPEAVKNLCKDVKVLILAVKGNRVKIVKFLIEKGEIIKELINQRVEVGEGSGIEIVEFSFRKPKDDEGKRDKETVESQPSGESQPLHIAAKNKNEGSGRKPSGIEVVEVSFRKPTDDEGKRDKTTVNSQAIVGDTPLHIAAKNKNEPILNMLLKVRGLNKHAFNSEGKTPLDVAKEVTEYDESFRIIEKLTDYPDNFRPFMYCAPEVSQEKHERARVAVNKTFKERRNAELVVAVLLATVTFAAVFTVPGGSYQDSDDPNRGSPILLGDYMFKVFIIFDCIAFFLALFVCIIWSMASELNTEDKLWFMTLSGLLTCLSFEYNSCAFTAAVYTVLEHKDRILARLILGNFLFIAVCTIIAFIYQSANFLVWRARFHRLFGVPRRLDDAVEKVWEQAERCGFLHYIRKLEESYRYAIEGDVDDACLDAIEGDVDEASKKEGEEEHELEHGCKCSCSSSLCLRNVSQSV